MPVDGNKVQLYGQYTGRSQKPKDVYQTQYKNGTVGKLWTLTGNGTLEAPTNRRYLTSEADLRGIVRLG